MQQALKAAERERGKQNGALKAQYAPEPMVASFMREEEPAVARRQHIPVPKGPVEVW